jgi:glycosyltransferase involved in cell wall biosynthesis
VNVVAIIPALNEEGSIAAVVRELPRPLVTRVIVVDNGSTDGTAKAALGAGAEVIAEHRSGYGHACMAGVAAASEAEIYLFLDGDHSDFPEESGLLIAPIADGRADLVLGSRELGTRERGALTVQARAGNRLAAALIGRLDRARITDLSPFKAIRGESLRSLGLQERTYGWTIELIVRAAQSGLRIEEAPVRYRNRLAGESKVSGSLRGTVKASARILLTLARLHRLRRTGGRITLLLAGGSLVLALLIARRNRIAPARGSV